jgi:hypothetical protein
MEILDVNVHKLINEIRDDKSRMLLLCSAPRLLKRISTFRPVALFDALVNALLHHDGFTFFGEGPLLTCASCCRQQLAV